MNLPFFRRAPWLAPRSGGLLGLLAVLLLAAISMASPAAAQTPPALANLAAIKPQVDCASLAALDISAATGAKTELTAAEVAGDKPYCKVTGTIAPAVRIEVRLPLAGWTQRYLQTGCGGLCGMVRVDAAKADGCAPVTDGSIVLATTDMGHAGMRDMSWGDDAQKRADFAGRSLHVTALAAKALIRAFYGQAPKYAYFSGCSDGGREALIMAQRYPADFDGIAAGAPALHFSVQNSFHHAWLAAANTGPDGKPLLTAIDMVPLHNAVLRACDRLDGLADGQIEDPRACRFNPGMVECVGAYDAGKCLSSAQVAAVRKIYDGARSPAGKLLEPGALMPGSEMQWIGVFVPPVPDMPIFSGMIAQQAINHLLFTPNPATPFTPQTLPYTEAMFARLEPARALYDADNPDLSAFAAHGGRLILWHGWADPHISPLSTLDYFERVGRKMTPARREAFARLFLFPGMGHCSGGDGPSDFPLLAGLMAWVEGGQAPDVMIAKRAQATREGMPFAGGMRRPDRAAPGGWRRREGEAQGAGPGAGPDGEHFGPPPGAMGNGQMPPPPEGAGPPPEGAPARLAAGGANGPGGPGFGHIPGMPERKPLPARSRPVYAWPRVARYAGAGSVDEANSFAPALPAASGPALIDWIGAR
ncbi:MAG TPA: tannase/feruloyl esterase family alpha/beta hydrolase [Novosphingobium sp.]|nr:tannase/feruloyl esterase family alpha/beta hydrolase [Novosphingobium sp.]